MPHANRPLLSRWSDVFGRLAEDVAAYFKARAELAGLEARESSQRLASYAAWLAVGGLAAALGWALLVVGLAILLGRHTALGVEGWLMLFGAAHLLGGVLFVLFLRRRMRREVRGLEQTIEEFQEDARWIKEDLWPPSHSDHPPPATSARPSGQQD